MLLVIDNYDSFTFNLVQYFGELAPHHPVAADLQVHRNDAITLAEIRNLKPDAILLSPGPGDPDQSGVCLDVLRELSPSIPTLGVCLGHQAIAQVHGGRVVRASEQMHGKTSPVQHRGEGVFAGLPQPLTATRYHSLIAERDSLPDCLEITAWLEDGTIMGLRHREHPHLQGVQFHPESVLTESGHQLLANFLRQAEALQHHQLQSQMDPSMPARRSWLLERSNTARGRLGTGHPAQAGGVSITSYGHSALLIKGAAPCWSIPSRPWLAPRLTEPCVSASILASSNYR